MTDPTVQVPFEAVRRHAANVEQAGAQVDRARSAAGQVHMGRDAYGHLCQFLPALLDGLQQTAIHALTESASGLLQTADNLRAVAGTSQTTDQTTASRVTRSGGTIELPL